MRSNSFKLLATALMVAMLWGCGSNRDSGGDQTTGTVGSFGADAAGIAFVGADTCINCHKDLSWSAAEVAGFLAGKHVVHSDHISQADAADGCLECHDPIGDGQTLEGLIDPASVPAGGLAAVTCENCHGAGGEHFGIGPIPTAKPDFTVCAGCHGELPESHLTYHPEANNIASKYEASAHKTRTIRNEAICSKCHTDEGARLYKNVTTKESLNAVVLPVEVGSPVQCRTCHDPHNAGALLIGEVEDHGDVVASAEYATCTSCHMGADTAVADLLYHDDKFWRVITDTHSDDPATPTTIEGYVVNPLSERSCRDCHDVHDVLEMTSEPGKTATNNIHTQWASSAHGGRLAQVKAAAALTETNRTVEQTIAVKAAAAGAAEADGWVHYDWDAGNRQSCQRCHTSTALVNFLADTVNYDRTANDFSHLSGWSKAEDGTVTPSGQNEMLYCWGCHSDNQGALRGQGQLTLDFVYEDPDATAGVTEFVVLPDKGNSNVCAACHSGRGNNTSIRTGSRSSRFAGHHAPTAGSLYAAVVHTGFEFDGQDYTTPALAHDDILESSSGPCVGCHMSGSSNHDFEAVTVDGGGAITAINNQALCNSCHGGSMQPADLSGLKADFEAARAVLTNLANNTTPNYLNTNLTVSAGFSTAPLEAYGSYQNSLYMNEEPCIYVHNSLYGKRLMFDSIDWLIDGALDGTIDTGAFPGVAAWLGATRP